MGIIHVYIKSLLMVWLQNKIIQIWYQKSQWLRYVLLPFSWLYYCIIHCRRYAYQHGWFRVYRAPVPVIVVGNITVGGTGKTPLVIAIANYFEAKGLRVGIVSRGYGVSVSSPRIVTIDDDPNEVGDEPLLIARRTQGNVVIHPQRVRSIPFLLEKIPCDLIIADDGLQHYAMHRDVEIVVVDGNRGFGNQCLLPAGPLREPLSRLKTVDAVVVNGEMKASPLQAAYAMSLSFDQLCQFNGSRCTLSSFQGKTVHAVAGIGNPERFFQLLSDQGLNVIKHPFSDHQQYTIDILQFADDHPIIMTEKDAVKCQCLDFESEDMVLYYLPVKAELSESLCQCLEERLMAPRDGFEPPTK